PARIIPAWEDFVSGAAGTKRIRGIGEPIWPGRGPAEMAECHRHEALLNVAFAGRVPFWLLCPYDVSALEPAVIDEAYRNHAFVLEGGVHGQSAPSRGLTDAGAPLTAPLAPAPILAASLDFGMSLDVLRRFVDDH